MKALDSNPSFNFNLETYKRKQIINAKSSVTVTITKIQLDALEEQEDGENLFHLQMWVKGDPLHLIVYSGS